MCELHFEECMDIQTDEIHSKAMDMLKSILNSFQVGSLRLVRMSYYGQVESNETLNSNELHL